MTERLRQLPKHVRGVPSDLLSRVEGLGKRAKPAEVRAAVLALCGWKPLTAAELSRILARGQGYITEHYLSPMVSSGELEYTIPEVPSHMKQAYKATEKAKSPEAP
jgi:ATP-dependent DNA helicase RecG